MGDAKRRQAQIEKIKSRESDWFSTLHGIEKTVAEVAKAAFKKIVVGRDLNGGCYHLSFFLREYLKREKRIDVEMVVGWITDDSWAGAISHAWIEHDGKKTDISLWLTENPEYQIPGAVLIHDYLYRRGVTQHTYHRELPKVNRDFLELVALKNAEFGIQYPHKMAEHLKIRSMAETLGGAAEYFGGAPAGMKYEVWAGCLD